MPISWLNWSLTQFQTFIIVLTRVAAVLFMMPILGTRYVPNLVKIGIGPGDQPDPVAAGQGGSYDPPV